MEHQTTSSAPSIPTAYGGTLEFFGLNCRRVMFKITNISLHSVVGLQTSFRYIFGSKAVCDEMFICPSPSNSKATNISFCLIVEKDEWRIIKNDDSKKVILQLDLEEYMHKVNNLFTEVLKFGHATPETEPAQLEEEEIMVM